ncbi:hypothetical protein [Paenibacillus sp. SYP-B4298]|nr:hypothetical protein [Paenibacillus sp. SYP-B4298]
MSHRYEQGSLVITSNLEFSSWVDVFGRSCTDHSLARSADPSLTHPPL